MIEILNEVIFNHIFPYLHINDLLRLRRVCKSIKPLAEDYLRIHCNLTRYISIDCDGIKYENSSRFLSLSFIVPLSKLHLENRNEKSFESSSLERLVEVYGERVTHLTVSSITIPIVSRRVIRFFESFPKLEYLGIQELCEREWLSKKKKNELPSETVEITVPSTFKTLKGLHIEDYCCRKNVRSAELVWKFVNECSCKLEYFHYPWFDDDMLCQLPNLPEGRFGYIRGMIERRHELFPNQPNLKYYNLRQFYDSEDPIIAEFYDLVTTCSKYGVKLTNVHAKLIQGLMELETWDMDQHGTKLSNVLSSVHFLESSCFLLEMPHLEKIMISEEHGTFCCTMPHWDFPRQAWPNLKELILWVDTGEMGTSDAGLVVETTDLLDFFFVGIRREKMERLEMHFSLNYYHKQDELPYPKMRDVCSSCPNLKILCISRWVGSNKAISKLWDNLPMLEDVTFDGCKGLANVAFVGKDKNNPCFLKLKKLQKLKLDGLQVMPKLTDTLFTLVLRHMKLRELYLCSWGDSVKTITVAGLESLKTGIFAESIEKFPLKTMLKLENVSAEELEQLEKGFRSSQMM